MTDAGQVTPALLKSRISSKDLLSDTEAGRLYGVKAKYRKLETLHKFMWCAMLDLTCTVIAVHIS